MKMAKHAILSPHAEEDEINVPIALSANTPCSVPVLVLVLVWAHILGDPQERSAEVRYNKSPFHDFRVF